MRPSADAARYYRTYITQTASLKKEHTEIEEKLDKLLDLLMDKVLDKAEFEAKKKKLKDRQYEIDEMIHSFDEAEDKFSNCLIDLINIATGALDDFKGSDVTRKRELLNFVFQNLQLRGKKTRNLKNGGGRRIRTFVG